jgi:hypothetical protein
VQFVPRHEVVARELVGVCRPGGMIALGNWAPAALVDFLADCYGPLLGARNKLSDGRWQPLRNELIALSNEMNAADDGHFRAPSEYLVTLAGKLN